jgi:hypothetical protein
MKDLKQRGLRIFQWFEKRTGLLKPLEEMARHPTPSSAASWWYVFGSAAMVLLIMQVMTGILLALVYSPSASNAYASLQFINHNLRLGWFLRAMHGWGSDFMIAIVLIHMMRASFCSCSPWAWPSPDRCCASIRTPTGAWALALPSPAAFRSSALPWCISCWADRSSAAPRFRASLRCTSS